MTAEIFEPLGRGRAAPRIVVVVVARVARMIVFSVYLYRRRREAFDLHHLPTRDAE